MLSSLGQIIHILVSKVWFKDGRFPVYMVKLSIYICDKLFGCFLLNSFFKSRNGIYEEVESEGLGERFPWGIEENIWNWNVTEVNVSVEAMWQEYLEFGAVEDLLSPR